MGYIKQILENDWYKTATPQEMRVALMHLEMNTMDRLNNQLCERYKEARQDCFESCAEDSGWNSKESKNVWSERSIAGGYWNTRRDTR